MPSDIFDGVDEIAGVLHPQRWMLVGGLMVHSHALVAGIEHPRPTDDADLVVELRAGSYGEAAAAVQQLGYLRHESLDDRAPFHRFTRGREHVDLMAPEDRTARFAGRPVLTVPGSRSALRRMVPFASSAAHSWIERRPAPEVVAGSSAFDGAAASTMRTTRGSTPAMRLPRR